MRLYSYIFLFVMLTVFSDTVFATSRYFSNIGFQQGSFSGWTGYNWVVSTKVTSVTTSPAIVGLPTARRQVLISDTTAYDANTGYKLKMVPTGYKYSCRLGDMIRSGDPDPRCWEQSMRYTLKVDSTNALVVLKFACVLQYSTSHDNVTEMEPRFKLSLLDSKANNITTSCANYDVYSSSAGITGFTTYTPSGSSTPVQWRDWTTVGANLLNYIGQTVTLELMSADCTGRYHYGYAYFVVDTQPLKIGVQYCSGDTKARLIAPDGFETYLWKDASGNTVETKKVLELSNPQEGAKYSCDMVSATGCQVTLTSTIVRYEPNADFNYEMVDCNKLTNTMKFANLYPAVNGTLEYNWNFGDGTSATNATPTHVFKSSGLHKVTLIVSNPPSTCTDSVTKTVETFYPPMVGISGDSLYCNGGTTTLRGYGAYRYQWFDGSTGDSITVGKDTTVWMIGYSSVGCYTDTIRLKVHRSPDWTLDILGKTSFCQGESTTITATPAVKYSWSTGETTPSVNVSKPGIYAVTGTNKYGCQLTNSVRVDEIPLPDMQVKVSRSTVDERHNYITCSAAGDTGVGYYWDMGDGSTETGSTIVHTYQVNNALPSYTIMLTAINANGCADTTMHEIEIVPFIPNVFTPNGDGVNELFLAGMKVRIIDRFGALMYEGNSGWNGTCNGTACGNDTYFYFVEYTDPKGREHKLKGYVLLKR